MAVSATSLISPLKTSSFSFSSSCDSGSSVSNLVFPRKQLKLCATADVSSLNGVVFEPFDEVKKDEFMVPMTPQTSLARQRFAEECEAAINEQIKSVFFFLVV